MYWAKEIEELPRKQLEELQAKKLREIVARAAKSEFYRQKFEQAGLRPEDIHTVRDLAKIPYTVKNDLRDNYPYGLLTVPLKDVVRMHVSSGTTGSPTVIFHTIEDIRRWADLMARSLAAAGCIPEDVFQNMTTYGMFTGGLGLHYGAETLGMMIIPASAGNTDRQIKLIQDFNTTVIHATPSYALHIGDVMQAKGHDPHQFGIRIAVLGAEPYSATTAAKLEKTFGYTAINSYGLSEMNGPGVAFECEKREGMHIWEDSYIAEIIDPDTGEPLPDGEEGELVLTTLDRRAMPILRYRTRDLTSFVDAPCSCGRTHRLLDRFKGRSDDMMIVSGVNIFPSQIEHILMDFPEVGTNYQIVLERAKSLDSMIVRVELMPDAFTGDIRDLNNIRKKMGETMRSGLLVRPNIELLEPGSLPVAQGKAVRVIDNRQL
jgi:phenylacetate-coenzyme A ligase PaaK-like adenylate-forming protein